jgi:hypothetical protein
MEMRFLKMASLRGFEPDKAESESTQFRLKKSKKSKEDTAREADEDAAFRRKQMPAPVFRWALEIQRRSWRLGSLNGLRGVEFDALFGIGLQLLRGYFPHFNVGVPEE